MDWNLRTCARRGHITYVPDEPDLRARLHATTPLGESWRCLRCGDYVLGPAHGSGPAGAAPLVRRGRELRDAFILRLLGAERMVRGLLLGLAAYGVWRFRSAQAGLRQLYYRDLPIVRPVARQLGLDLEQSAVLRWWREAITARSGTLLWLAVVLAGYAALELTEGVGLWMLRRWAEYLTAAATALFLPLEVYELTERVTWLRVSAFVINVAAVVYLVYTKRLFGARGGRAAYDEQRREVSLLEVESTAGMSQTSVARAPSGS